MLAPRLGWLASSYPRYHASGFQVHGGLLSALLLNVVTDLLSLVQAVKSSAVDSRDVNEHVLAAAVWLNEAKAFGRVEPLHGACRHCVYPRSRRETALQK